MFAEFFIEFDVVEFSGQSDAARAVDKFGDGFVIFQIIKVLFHGGGQVILLPETVVRSQKIELTAEEVRPEQFSFFAVGVLDGETEPFTVIGGSFPGCRQLVEKGSTIRLHRRTADGGDTSFGGAVIGKFFQIGQHLQFIGASGVAVLK